MWAPGTIFDCYLYTDNVYMSHGILTCQVPLYGHHTNTAFWHLCVTCAEGFVHGLWHMTGFQLLWVIRIGRKWLQTIFWKFYGHTYLVHTFDTSVSHMLKMCSLTVTYDWFRVMWGKSWRVPNVGPFGEFMISPIHYIYIIYYWVCQM